MPVPGVSGGGGRELGDPQKPGAGGNQPEKKEGSGLACRNPQCRWREASQAPCAPQCSQSVQIEQQRQPPVSFLAAGLGGFGTKAAGVSLRAVRPSVSGFFGRLEATAIPGSCFAWQRQPNNDLYFGTAAPPRDVLTALFAGRACQWCSLKNCGCRIDKNKYKKKD
jgi:hypothetical protein